MAAITNDWLPAISPEFQKPYYKELYSFVKKEYSEKVIYPPADDIFNAFHFTPLSKVKVLILGQDPYHNEHQAHGLSFSVPPDQKDIPPSLQNIYKELNEDLGCKIPNNGYLKEWADQGVLMLNTVLTVRAHQANSHQGKGWEQFTDAVIQAVNEQDRPIVQITYFLHDDRKSGGSYEKLIGSVRHVDEGEMKVVFADGTKLDIADICGIDGEIFENIELR